MTKARLKRYAAYMSGGGRLLMLGCVGVSAFQFIAPAELAFSTTAAQFDWSVAASFSLILVGEMLQSIRV